MRCRLGGESVGVQTAKLYLLIAFISSARVCCLRQPPTPNNINEMPADRGGFMSLDLQQPGRVAQGKWSDPATLYTLAILFRCSQSVWAGGCGWLDA